MGLDLNPGILRDLDCQWGLVRSPPGLVLAPVGVPAIVLSLEFAVADYNSSPIGIAAGPWAGRSHSKVPPRNLCQLWSFLEHSGWSRPCEADSVLVLV
jgi:hypothetical protein